MRLLPSKKGHIALAAAGIVAMAVISFSTACAGSKAAEPFNDAPVSGQNNGPAEKINMPDGFSNVATKCDHGNRIYVAFHSDGAYAAIAVVANDPSCGGVVAK